MTQPNLLYWSLLHICMTEKGHLLREAQAWKVAYGAGRAAPGKREAPGPCHNPPIVLKADLL